MVRLGSRRIGGRTIQFCTLSIEDGKSLLSVTLVSYRRLRHSQWPSFRLSIAETLALLARYYSTSVILVLSRFELILASSSELWGSHYALPSLVLLTVVGRHVTPLASALYEDPSFCKLTTSLLPKLALDARQSKGLVSRRGMYGRSNGRLKQECIGGGLRYALALDQNAFSYLMALANSKV